MKNFKLNFLRFFLVLILNSTLAYSSNVCEKIISTDYYFPDRFVKKLDHGITLEDYDDPDSEKIFILQIDNFSPAKKAGIEGSSEIYSINGETIDQNSFGSFDETLSEIERIFDTDNFKISIINDQNEIIDHNIKKEFYNNEPEVLSQYYIDRIEIINLNRDAKVRFRVWTDWQNENLINYFKANFSNNNEFKCEFSNPNNIEKLLQKFWYPILKIDQTGSYFDITDILKIKIDTNSTDPFQIEYDFEATVLTSTDLKKFPFDSLNFYLDLNYFSGGDIFLADNWEEQIEDGIDRTNRNLFEWQITSGDLIFIQDVDESDNGETFQGHEISFELKRNTVYYFIKIILPVIFIVLISFGVFWIKNQEIEARLNVSIVSLLALIAYNFVYNSELPKLNFITIIDAIVLISYLFSGIATILSIYSYYDYRRDNQKGEFNPLDIRMRYLAPSFYLLAIIVISLIIYSY